MHTISDLDNIYFEEDLRVDNLIIATQLGISLSQACSNRMIKDSKRNLKEVIKFFKSKNVNLK